MLRTTVGLICMRCVNSNHNDDQLERAQSDPMASKTSCMKSYNMSIRYISLTLLHGLGMDASGLRKLKENVINIAYY